MARSTTPLPAKPRLRARGFLRVLLVDDEDMVRRCLARTLSEFEVIGAKSGHDALAILAADSDFDAVLSDVVMPRMSGPELFARCYHDYPKLSQRFVFASGNPESARGELMRVVQELGASQPPILLSKPCPREGLLLALFAAAAHAEPHSGTFSVVDGTPPEVTKYWG